MAIEFRCEKCGKLLSLDASQPADKTTCPQCHAEVAVPAALASLPRPQVPPNAAPPPTAEPLEAPAEEPQTSESTRKLMRHLSVAMPWIFSLFLHVALFLIMTLGVMVVVKADKMDTLTDTEQPIPSDDPLAEGTPGGVPNPGDTASNLQAQQTRVRSFDKGWSRHEAAAAGPSGVEAKGPAVIGVGGGASGGGMLAEFGGTDRGGGSGYGPRNKFLGTGGNAHHVVFVIDNSGSMAYAGFFDRVAREMSDSIGKLKESQDFHIIFFGATVMENPPRRLVQANPTEKASAGKFLKLVSASGKGSDPTQALNRAFDVLANAASDRKGKLIFLLSDGEFDNRDEVLKVIKNNKARPATKDVQIYTFFYGGKDEGLNYKTMKQIAEDNNGKITVVNTGE